MNWIILIVAGFCEAGFTFCLGKAKVDVGNKAWWLLGFLVFLTTSMLLLMKAVKTLPIGTAYAVWTGIGATVTAIVGMVVFKEPTSFWRVFFIVTLILSVIGLKFVANE